MLTALENVGSDSDDEETRRWEEEQISKGIKASNPQQPDCADVPTDSTLGSQMFTYGSTYYGAEPYSAAYNEPPRKPLVQSGLAIPDKLVPITLETLKSKLCNRLHDIEVGVAS